MGCEVKIGFFFKMGEIIVCLYVDGNDIVIIYKIFLLVELVLLTFLEEDDKCNIF